MLSFPICVKKTLVTLTLRCLINGVEVKINDGLEIFVKLKKEKKRGINV